MTQSLSDAELKVMEKVQKLLDKAADEQGTTPEERAVFAAKAQELMTQYNLDAALIERTAGIKDGKREDLKMRGGFYKWQADLWQSVAQLNFCLYWTQVYFVPQKERHILEGRSSLRRQKRHRLVGRIINTTATRVMAEYLEQAIERAVNETLKVSHTERMSNYANSFRLGAAEELMRKVSERYEARLDKERAEAAVKAAQKSAAASADASTATALTLTDYEASEEDANADFIHGEGYSARKRAQAAEYARERAQREAEATAWAAANPEEAAAKEAERQAESEKYWRRYRGRGGAGPRDKTDYGAYGRGREAGKKISIDPQMANSTLKQIRGG